MMHRRGWTGPRATSSIPFAWFCWDRNHKGPTTIDRISVARGPQSSAGDEISTAVADELASWRRVFANRKDGVDARVSFAECGR